MFGSLQQKAPMNQDLCQENHTPFFPQQIPQHFAKVDADAEMVDEDGLFGSTKIKVEGVPPELLGGASCQCLEG